MDSLDSAILKTIHYFNLFEYPLTSVEVWKWLWSDGGQSATMIEVEQQIVALKKNEQIDCQQGYWFLPSRSGTVNTRQDRHRLSIAKFKRAKRFAKMYSLIPWVEGIAICNSLGYRNASAQSDIDLLIITRPGAVWLTRLFATGFTALMGARPTHEHMANTVCLSFFVSRDALNFESLKKEQGDPYLTYWMTTLTPVFGRGNVWENFWKENQWVKKTVPNALPYMNSSDWVYRASSSGVFPGIPVGERVSERIQRWRLPATLMAQSHEGNNVVITNEMLKFHGNDRRDEYRERWLKVTSFQHSSPARDR